MDSQYTMDLFCNPSLVTKTFNSSSSMQININSVTIVVTYKAKMAGYHKTIWFSKRAITNIIALINIIQQYQVTYDSEENMFIFHLEAEDKSNMEFRMHKSGLHYYEPRNKHFSFINTVSGNKEGYTQRQIKSAEVSRTIYSKL